MTDKELISKIREEILHLKMKELQRTNGINTGADVYLSSYAVLSILSNALTEESEDERIRKEAISIVQSYMNICDKEGDPCLSGYNVLAWLENQKEQKPVEWKPTEEQMNALNFAITYMFSTKANPTVLRDLYEQLKQL